MKYAQQAKDYRLEGRYQLALRCAEASQSTAGKIEHIRALCWLAQYTQAESLLEQLPQPKGPEYIDYLSAAVICRINLGQHKKLQHLLLNITTALENFQSLFSQIQLQQLMALVNGVLAESSAVIHAEAALELAKPFNESRIYCDTAFTYADALHRAQRYPEAFEAWEHCLSHQKSLLRAGHTEIALSFDGFALTLRQLGNAKDAILLHEYAYAIYAAELPVFHPAIGACHHGLAQALLRCGHTHKAARNMRLALQCAEHNLPQEHPDIALTRFELGRAEYSCGNQSEGLKNMRYALDLSIAQLGAEHPMIERMLAWVEKMSGEN